MNKILLYLDCVSHAGALNLLTYAAYKKPGETLDRSKHHGRKDVNEVNEGRREGRRRAGRPKPASSQAATLRSRRPTATPRCRSTSLGMPGWKSDVGRRLDELIERNVPDTRKAVRWTRPSMASRAKGGSCVSTSSPIT